MENGRCVLYSIAPSVNAEPPTPVEEPRSSDLPADLFGRYSVPDSYWTSFLLEQLWPALGCLAIAALAIRYSAPWLIVAVIVGLGYYIRLLATRATEVVIDDHVITFTGGSTRLTVRPEQILSIRNSRPLVGNLSVSTTVGDVRLSPGIARKSELLSTLARRNPAIAFHLYLATLSDPIPGKFPVITLDDGDSGLSAGTSLDSCDGGGFGGDGGGGCDGGG